MGEVSHSCFYLIYYKTHMRRQYVWGLGRFIVMRPVELIIEMLLM